MNFERGGDIKEIIGIGRDGLLKTMGGRIIGIEEYETWKKLPNTKPRMIPLMNNDENLIILVENGTYEILKNRFSNNYSKGSETELVKTLLELLEEFNKWNPEDSIWINTNGNVGIGTMTPSVKLNVK